MGSVFFLIFFASLATIGIIILRIFEIYEERKQKEGMK